jgi:hypothetical protein
MKRTNGEASVYRRDHGWEAAYLVDGPRRTFRAMTSREARERLKEVLQKLQRGERLLDEQLTVAKYLEYWLTTIEPTIRPSTHKRYREYVRVHALPEIGPDQTGQAGANRPADALQQPSCRGRGAFVGAAAAPRTPPRAGDGGAM